MIYFCKIVLCVLTLWDSFCYTNTAVLMPHSIVVDSATQSDLDLICSKRTISDIIDRTLTQRGREELDKHLLHPVDDVDIIRARQLHIQFFAAQAEYAAALKEQLDELKIYETSLKQENKEQLAQQALSRVYFSMSQLRQYNTNPYALDVAYGMHIASLCGPLVEHIILHIGIDLLANGNGHDDHDHHHHGCSHHHHDISGSGPSWTYYGLQGLHWGLHIPGLYDMATDIQDRALMIKYIQYQSIHIARYVQHAREIYRLLATYNAKHSLDTFRPYTILEQFFGSEPGCSAEMQALFDLLNTNTFKGDPSYWSHVGNVLAAYKRYHDVQEEFEQLIKALGQIDMYLSVASLMQHENPNQHWAFVNFIEKGQTPCLVLDKVRNLFVAESNPVNFSSEKSTHRLVTGDNGVGKSTYLMSIGHALILALTFGIVPAQACTMTPFSQIYTFRIIQDDFSSGVSRFYAECARVENILNNIHDNTGFSCVILDEPFAHTNPQKGTAHLKQTLESLGLIHNTISMVATHYRDVESSWYVEHLT